jgi:hypothetical protein
MIARFLWLSPLFCLAKTRPSMEPQPELDLPSPAVAPPRWVFNNRWYDLLVQMVAIFVSITLSFAVNQCQENRKNRETERFYLRQILADLKEDLVELEKDRASYAHLLQGYVYFQKYDHLANSRPDSLQALSPIFFTEVSPNINNLGFETLRNLGKLDVVSNQDILAQLTKIHQEELPTLKAGIDYYLAIRRGLLVPYLADQLKYGPKQQNGNYAELLKSTKFRVLLSLGMTCDPIEKQYASLIAHFQTLQKMIEQELATHQP